MNEQKTSEKPGVIAVSQKELQQWGCPHCGYRSGTMSLSGDGAGIWSCGECGKTTVVLAEGVTKSPYGLGTEKEGESFHPELQPHPRHGIPAHGNPDKRPEGGGEFFSSRGIGMDMTPSCFVCGGKSNMRSNITAFVHCKASGKRVVAMFRKGARLDYRESEPDRIQVKVGACKEHLQNLEHLDTTTRQSKGVITGAMIAEARN
jgi:ribosomal protein L37AE/L43A